MIHRTVSSAILVCFSVKFTNFFNCLIYVLPLEQMEKHWIGVVLAVSGVLTVVITGTVYCCFRKRSNEFKSKKLKMTFYRE